MPEQRATLDNMDCATVRDLIADLGDHGGGLRLIEGINPKTSCPVLLIIANGYAAALLREVVVELQRLGEAQVVVKADRRGRN